MLADTDEGDVPKAGDRNGLRDITILIPQVRRGTMPGSSTPGLRFRKLDLHIHTPASSCFRGSCEPADLVQAALDRDLEAIAVTDHNSAASVDAVREAAKGTSLVVFPGVEISCTGGKKSVHIIALFDPTASSKHVEALLNVVDIGPDQYGKQDAVSDKAPIQVLEAISAKGALGVIAHANSANGVLSDMSGQPRTNVIQCPHLLAAEGTDYGDEDKKAAHKRVADLLDGSDSTYRRRLAVYQASDNLCPDGSGEHCLEGVGTRYCYFKMEQINLDGLRQCFIDPQVRIRHPEDFHRQKYPRITHVAVNSGFLENQEARFHEGLTTILGAKGAGKSLLVEFMRFALNQESVHPSISSDHVAKLRSKLGEYGQVSLTYEDENGASTTVTRAFRELDASPYGDDVPFDPAQIFPVLFLSQNEIIKIAEDEAEQLKFIDQFFDFRTIRLKIATIERDLQKLDAAMAQGLSAYDEVASLGIRIATVEKEVSKLDAALENPIFARFRASQDKERLLLAQRDYLSTLLASSQEATSTLLAMPLPAIPGALAEDPSVLRMQDALSRAQAALAAELNRLSAAIEKELASASEEHAAWHPQYLEGKTAYEEHIQRSGGDYKGLALRRDHLARDLADLQRNLMATEAKKAEVPSLSKRRNDLLDDLQRLHDLHTKERQAKCDKFQADSAGKLQLRIFGASNVEQFSASLMSLKRGSYLRDEEIEQITANVGPRDFVISLLRYHATRESRHLEGVSSQSDIPLARMKILADFLIGAIPFQDLLALQYRALPQDRPEILYDIGDGKFQPLSAVSVGQKCTAMLIMALSEGAMPIVIDQPEDSLDIRSVWDDMCTKLRVGKDRRQFIFTTHNSSLAVASDTDCYLILEGDANRGRIVHMGSMDHQPVSSEVMRYLEGGPETHQLKSAKYKASS